MKDGKKCFFNKSDKKEMDARLLKMLKIWAPKSPHSVDELKGSTMRIIRKIRKSKDYKITNKSNSSEDNQSTNH